MSFAGNTREVCCTVNQSEHSASILCRLMLGPQWKRTYPCKVDTGAGLTLIPRWIWSQEIASSEILSLPDHPFPVTTAGNERLTCKAGPREISIVGHASSEQDSTTTSQMGAIVKETLYLGECHVLYNIDRSQDRSYILLGLGGGTLDAGGFCINWNYLGGHPKAVFVEQL